ncbi:MAG: ZIP family metal transporter [Oscillospiraceae bacterium]|nr:ZIP family metal transporter [Oscillospiraceae bacterium]
MFYPVILCTFAGLSTAIGGLIVILSGGVDNRKMAFSQGFAAGVMLAVSAFELLPESFAGYYEYMPVLMAFKAVISLFFCGWVAGMGINGLAVPDYRETDGENMAMARRMAVITTVVMVIHNMPEGVLTMFSSRQNEIVGAKLAAAVALHNIPEGMAIASPVLYVTQSRGRAFAQTFMAGMSELAGGLAAYVFFKSLITPRFMNGLMPVIAGIMCRAAICELIPAGIKISDNRHTIYGILTGIVIIAIGLFVF